MVSGDCCRSVTIVLPSITNRHTTTTPHYVVVGLVVCVIYNTRLVGGSRPPTQAAQQNRGGV